MTSLYPVMISISVFAIGGLCAALLSPSRRWSSFAAVASVWIGCALALPSVIAALFGRTPTSLKAVWSIPWGSWYASLDGLSAFFLLPILILSPLTALYGARYLSHSHKPLGGSWFFFTMLVASMTALVVARNGLMFLVAWEVMAVSSFFLVMFDHEYAHVRDAGWLYLVATHIGTAFLLVMFASLGASARSLDFDRIAAAALSPSLAGILFVLAVIGFGTKAGFMPLHVWLPEAHPAAPSHVSALMSGIMIKMGVYGLLRVLTLLGTPPAAWGWTLLIIGVVSGILGVAFALAQHDLKRLLAYHSVENIGIIAMGIGTGVLGISWNKPALMLLGFGGGILHVLNHALFKGLLFLGAGAVGHGAGTLDIDRCGGLLKRMPWTGAAFVVGAAAISGLPPLNGFVSEFLIYAAGFHGALTGKPDTVVLAVVILAGLALIGGLAAACFTKCFGIVFLGEPRDEETAKANDAPLSMRWPMMALAVLCLAVGLAAPWSLRLVLPAVQVMTGSTELPLRTLASGEMKVLTVVSILFGSLIALSLLFMAIRKLLPRANDINYEETWGCGYAHPTARMQYTSSSYADPLIDLFKTCLGTHEKGEKVTGYFPKHASFSSHTPDIAREKLFRPLFLFIDRIAAPFRMVQHGGLHLYVFYVVITLVALLFWKVGLKG